MANYPYPANFLGPLPAWPLKASCEKMIDSINDTVEGLHNVQEFVYALQKDAKCHDMKTEYV